MVDVTSRVDIQLFVTDLLAQRDPVAFERYPGQDHGSLRLEDGAGLKVAISGDRSSLRMLLSGALTQLAPPNPPLERHDEPPVELDTGEPQAP